MATVSTGLATSFITFSRPGATGGGATVTDADGRIKWAGHNLVQHSESFDNSYWLKVGGTISANTTLAPNGTTTADTYSASSGSARHCVLVSAGFGVVSAAQHTASVFIKKGTHNYVTVTFLSLAASGYWTAATVDFSSSTPVISKTQTSASATALTPTIEAAANGFWRVSLTGTLNNSPASIEVALASSATPTYDTYGEETWTAAGTETVIVWGAHCFRSDLGGMQLNPSLPAGMQSYYPTTPRNLLGYSEAFNSWSKGAATITANAAVAPNGLQTANLISGTSIDLSQGVTGANLATKHTYSVYLKAGTVTSVSMGVFKTTGGQNGAVVFDLVAGTAGTPSGTFAPTNAAITSAGNGWYRCSFVTAFDTGTGMGVWLQASPYASTGNFYAWGAQLSDSASLDTYVPVYGAAVTSAAYYAPRLDFDGATLAAKGLLVEEQRTNILQRTAEFNNAYWQKSNSGASDPVVTANSVVAPDGTTTADKIEIPAVSGAGAFSVISRNFTATATPHTGSIWLRGNTGGEVIWLGYTTNGSTYASVSCTLTTSWQRFTLTSTRTAVSDNFQFGVDLRDGAQSAKGAQTIYAWGAQLEQNASFATSYIPNIDTSAGVTRAADVASVSTQAFPYSSSEGTLVVNASVLSTASGNRSVATLYQASNSAITTGNNASGFGATTADFYVINNSVDQAVFYFNSAVTAGSPFKVGGFYKANNFNGSVNGTVGTLDTSGSVPSGITEMRIGQSYLGTATYLNGHIRQITYLPRAVTTPELAARTA